MKISEKANQICQTYYAKQCGVCTIRKECVAYVGLGQEGFVRWVLAVNKAADRQ
ncbi:hypothetical protein ABEV55_18405 [Aneurinibacillus thermoaerophilus]|jgi:hypothetical protein|uniref:hypothetical protein n=1 Tax=Aneurinibacillus thermoaerophilus TaxID=143495 RepID=UPI002E243DAE|nr:hypothetical protein [Aneurinibacillus thermoaerophilus]